MYSSVVGSVSGGGGGGGGDVGVGIGGGVGVGIGGGGGVGVGIGGGRGVGIGGGGGVGVGIGQVLVLHYGFISNKQIEGNNGLGALKTTFLHLPKYLFGQDHRLDTGCLFFCLNIQNHLQKT
ncbi:hypothetical protein Tco_1576817 [Tanacetum coccineum]